MIRKLTLKWNFQEIGIGCGQNFISIKNIMDIFIHYSVRKFFLQY